MIVKYLGRGYHGVFPISSDICNVKVKQANTISWKVNEYYLYMSTCQHLIIHRNKWIESLCKLICMR